MQTKANHVIIEQGAHDRALYLIEDGEVEVLRDGRRVARLDPGDMVGEIAFVDERPRTATVRTTKPSAFTMIDRADVARALSEDPEALWTWTCAVSERVRSRLDVAPDPSRTNVAAWLDDLRRQVLDHRILRHPYVEQLRTANFEDPKAALADFVLYSYQFSSQFPRYLTAALSRLDVHEHRLLLLPALQETLQFDATARERLSAAGLDVDPWTGHNRAELNLQLLRSLGLDRSAVEVEQLCVVCWRELFLATLTQGTPAEAVGTLAYGAGYTSIAVYTAALPTLRAIPDVKPQDAAFLYVAALHPPPYLQTMQEIALHHAETPEGRRDLIKGMNKAMMIRLALFETLASRDSARPRR